MKTTASAVIATVACVAALTLFIAGYQIGVRNGREMARAEVLPFVPAPLACPASVAVDLMSGDSAIRITTSGLGHRVIADPGSGHRFLMLRVADNVARETQ